MADKSAITLHDSDAETLAGNGASVDIGALRTCVRLRLDVTVITAATSISIVIETSPTGVGWQQVGTFNPTGAIGSVDATFGRCRRFVRARWTIAGTLPSVTFSVAGEAHVLYTTPDDLPRYAINKNALANIEESVKTDCCLRSTDEFETALNSSYTLPITAWGEDFRGHCAARAVFHVMNHRGRAPNNEADRLIDLAGGYMTAEGVKSGAQMYLDAIAKGNLKPVGIVDQTPDEYEGAGFVISDAART